MSQANEAVSAAPPREGMSPEQEGHLIGAMLSVSAAVMLSLPLWNVHQYRQNVTGVFTQHAVAPERSLRTLVTDAAKTGNCQALNAQLAPVCTEITGIREQTDWLALKIDLGF